MGCRANGAKLKNDRMINETEITINSKVYSAGTHLREIKLTSGTNTLNSSGSATLNFQEGEI